MPQMQRKGMMMNDFGFEINENLKIFMQKVMEDEELAARLSQCGSPEEAYAIASSVQEGFTMEEFVGTMTRIYESLDQELSEEDLAMAAGGVENIVSLTVGVTCIIFSGGGLAAMFGMG